MLDEKLIRDVAKRLADAAPESKIVLFGSYARGTATQNSDLDFLVIKPYVTKRRTEVLTLRRAIRPLPISADILVYSEEEVSDWGHLPGSFLYWALKEGKVLHEKPK